MKAAVQHIAMQVEHSLSRRNGAPFSQKAFSTERIPLGLADMEKAVPAGVPVGAITEFVGPESSGRTTAALSLLVNVQHLDQVCAWIDVADALDPETVAANGIDLERLLWVRCGPSSAPPPRASLGILPSVSAASEAPAQPPRHTGGGSPHPRSEGRNMPQAVEAMLQAHGGLYDKQVRRERKSIGTPGMANRPLSSHAEDREEQINFDRLPPRRGDNLAIVPRCAEPLPRRVASVPSNERLVLRAVGSTPAIRSKPWSALDQALRATDLLLQNGGFGAIILDLGGTAPEFAWRIPLATWFRFRAACERSRTSLILLTQHPCARSSAGLMVRLQPGSMEADGKVMTGIRYCATTERSRFQHEQARVVPIRKPPQSERPGQWKSKAAWARPT